VSVTQNEIDDTRALAKRCKRSFVYVRKELLLRVLDAAQNGLNHSQLSQALREFDQHPRRR
jgi:hypothetical protein